MTNYEIREFQSAIDNLRHIDIYADEKLENSFFFDGNVWIEESTQKGTLGETVQDIIEQNVYGDLDDYEITENDAYGVEYTYYTLKDDEE